MGFQPPLFEILKLKRNLYQQGHNIKDTTLNQLFEQDGNKQQRKRPKTHQESENTRKQQSSTNDNNTNTVNQPPPPPHAPHKRLASPTNCQDALKKVRKSTDDPKTQEQSTNYAASLEQLPPGIFIHLLNVQDTISFLLTSKKYCNNPALSTAIKNAIHPTLLEQLTPQELQEYKKTTELKLFYGEGKLSNPPTPKNVSNPSIYNISTPNFDRTHNIYNHYGTSNKIMLSASTP